VRNLTESKKIIRFELNQSLFEALQESIREESKQEPVRIPFKKEEMDQIDKARLIKKWKKTEGYYYLNPHKFRFSLKDL